MKILITGSAGFVGKYLFMRLQHNHQVFGISRRASVTTTHPMDITSENLSHVLDEIKPDIIIHAAALTNVDYCETHQEETWKMNVDGTKNIVSWASQHAVKCIYISTYYVYAGKEKVYTEASETLPVNFYGHTKLVAERLVSSLPDYTILRPASIFGYDPGGKNFLMQILSTQAPRKVVDDQISNHMDIEVLCDYVEGVIKKNIHGIYNIAGPTPANRFDFTLLIAEIFGLNKELFERISTAELRQIALRPLSNATDSSKLRTLLDYDCPKIEESLLRIKAKMNLTR